MLRLKDIISVLLGAMAVAGVGSKPTFIKSVHLYFSTIYKMKSDKLLFMRNISRIRGRIIAKKYFPDCRNFGMLNNRTVANYSWCTLHHRVKQPLPDYFGLFHCVGVLDTSTEFCMCKTCRWLWWLFRNCRGVPPSANYKYNQDPGWTRLD